MISCVFNTWTLPLHLPILGFFLMSLVSFVLLGFKCWTCTALWASCRSLLLRDSALQKCVYYYHETPHFTFEEESLNRFKAEKEGGANSWQQTKHEKRYILTYSRLKRGSLWELWILIKWNLGFCSRGTILQEKDWGGGGTRCWGFYSDFLTPSSASRHTLQGVLRTQKLKTYLLRTQSSKVLPVKPGAGRYIAMLATPTANDFFWLISTPRSIHLHLFQNSPAFFLCWLWLTPVPVWDYRIK